MNEGLEQSHHVLLSNILKVNNIVTVRAYSHQAKAKKFKEPVKKIKKDRLSEHSIKIHLHLAKAKAISLPDGFIEDPI